MQDIAIVEADLGNPQHQDAIVYLVDAYARDPMGGGKALPEEVRTALIPGCSAIPRHWFFSPGTALRRWGLPFVLSGSQRFWRARSSTSMISLFCPRIVGRALGVCSWNRSLPGGKPWAAVS